jgi:hypothetical protein
MILGVISDTHSLLRPEAVAALRGVDRIIHAGDIGGPEVLTSLAALAPVVAVRATTTAARGRRRYRPPRLSTQTARSSMSSTTSLSWTSIRRPVDSGWWWPGTLTDPDSKNGTASSGSTLVARGRDGSSYRSRSGDWSSRQASSAARSLTLMS